MTFERAKCVGRSLYGNMQYAICYCYMLSNRNETKWNAVAKSHLKMHNKNLFIGLDPVSVAWLHIRLVSSRLGSTLLASRGSMLCKPGSLFYIYFSSFFSHFFFYHTHNTLNLLHKNPNNSTNIYGRSQQKSIQFSSPPRCLAPAVSFCRHIPVSFGRRLCGFVLLVCFGCTAFQRCELRTGPDKRNKSAKQPHPRGHHKKMSPDQIKII